MKRTFITTFFLILILLPYPYKAFAQGIQNNNTFSKEDVEKLIEEKLSEDKPLTNDELNKMIIDLKDEKIENLEGNISKVIDVGAWFIGAIALFVTAVTGLIGFSLNRTFNKKINKAESLYREITTVYEDINKKAKEITDLHNDVKSISPTLRNAQSQLKSSTEEIKQASIRLESLGSYVNFVEDLALSSLYLHEIKSRVMNETPEYINMARTILNTPQEDEELVISTLNHKNLTDIFYSQLDVIKYFEQQVNEMKLEEEKIMVRLETKYIDDIRLDVITNEEDVNLLLEDLEDIVYDWQYILNKIKLMEGIWSEYLDRTKLSI